MKTLASELKNVTSEPKKYSIPSKYRTKQDEERIDSERLCKVVWSNEKKVLESLEEFSALKIAFALLRVDLDRMTTEKKAFRFGKKIFERQLKWFAECNGLKELEV